VRDEADIRLPPDSTLSVALLYRSSMGSNVFHRSHSHIIIFYGDLVKTEATSRVRFDQPADGDIVMEWEQAAFLIRFKYYFATFLLKSFRVQPLRRSCQLCRNFVKVMDISLGLSGKRVEKCMESLRTRLLVLPFSPAELCGSKIFRLWCTPGFIEVYENPSCCSSTWPIKRQSSLTYAVTSLKHFSLLKMQEVRSTLMILEALRRIWLGIGRLVCDITQF